MLYARVGVLSLALPEYAAEDLEDDVPVVAEGTTYNIHGGRDMFAKRTPTKKREKPPIAKKPTLERVTLTRTLHMQQSTETQYRCVTKASSRD